MNTKTKRKLIFSALSITCGIVGGLLIDFGFYGTGAFLGFTGLVLLVGVTCDWFD